MDTIAKKKFAQHDFGMSISDENGIFVKLEELNKMITAGAIIINSEKMEEYKFDTQIMYDKERMTRQEALALWKATNII